LNVFGSVFSAASGVLAPLVLLPLSPPLVSDDDEPHALTAKASTETTNAAPTALHNRFSTPPGKPAPVSAALIHSCMCGSRLGGR
jgi:hypothetical protein